MRLEDLYTNFGEQSPEDQLKFIAEYRLRRAEDMEKPSTFKKKRRVNSTPKPVLTEEEKVVMKLLGLKQKDIIALREAATSVDDSDDADLFNEDSFDTDDEED